MKFTPKVKPTHNGKLPTVPYFDESKAERIPGWSVKRSVESLQSDVAREIADLGGVGVRFHEGEYTEGELTRHGFSIEFFYEGFTTRIDCAALPVRAEHVPAKRGAAWRDASTLRERALKQALFLTRDWLKAERLSWVHRPNANPLVPYVSGDDGETVIEAAAHSIGLPLLGAVAGAPRIKG